MKTVEWKVRPVTHFEVVRIEDENSEDGRCGCSVETFGFYLSQERAEQAVQIFKGLTITPPETPAQPEAA